MTYRHSSDLRIIHILKFVLALGIVIVKGLMTRMLMYSFEEKNGDGMGMFNSLAAWRQLRISHLSTGILFKRELCFSVPLSASR